MEPVCVGLLVFGLPVVVLLIFLAVTWQGWGE